MLSCPQKRASSNDEDPHDVMPAKAGIQLFRRYAEAA
jgi:hypothetical protein